MSALFNPFHALAVWLVSLLPQGAGELAVGSTVLLGIFLVLLAILAPACLLGALIENKGERHRSHS